MKKNVLWFSRHTMTPEQKEALGDVEITQINGNMGSVHEEFPAEITEEDGTTTNSQVVFKEYIKAFDVVAIVAPLALQQQILAAAGETPVIIAKTNRVFVEKEKAVFQFAGWERIIRIEVVTEPFKG